MLQPNLVSVTPEHGHKLKLVYASGEQKVFDVAPYMDGDWYGQLKNQSYFNQVRLVDGGYGIEWPNGQDIAPHELYECGKPCVPLL